MLVKINDDKTITFPYTIEDLRSANKGTSFPKRITPEFLSRYGIYPVTVGAAPDYDVATQNVVRADTPVLQEGGSWVLPLVVEDKTADEVSEYLQRLAATARQRRAFMLTESDWTQNRDVQLANDAEWQAYRQALRDITNQAGFPENIVWPTKPE